MAGEAVIFDIGMDTSSFDGAMAGLKAETAKASSSLDSSFSRSFDRLASAAGSAGTADPLDQISTVGWKMDGFGAKLLQPEYAVRIECGFSA